MGLNIDILLGLAAIVLLALAPIVMVYPEYIGEWIVAFGLFAIADAKYGHYNPNIVKAAIISASLCAIVAAVIGIPITTASLIAILAVIGITEIMIYFKSAGDADRLIYVPLVLSPFIAILGIIGGGIIQTIGRYIKWPLAERFIFTSWIVMLLALATMPGHYNQICDDVILTLSEQRNCSRLIVMTETHQDEFGSKQIPTDAYPYPSK